MTPPAMNTRSRKCQLPHPADQLKEENLLIDTGNFFTLPNMLDDHTYVHIIQQDTCLYDIRDLEPEDITERMRIKKKQADKRRMRRIRQAAEVQARKVKQLKRELRIAHKKSRSEDGTLGIVWWNQEYWGTGFGVKRLGIKKEEPLTPQLVKVEPPTPPLTYHHKPHHPFSGTLTQTILYGHLDTHHPPSKKFHLHFNDLTLGIWHLLV